MSKIREAVRKVPPDVKTLQINYSILSRGVRALYDLDAIILRIDRDENIPVEELKKVHEAIGIFNEASGVLGIGCALNDWLEAKIKERGVKASSSSLSP